MIDRSAFMTLYAFLIGLGVVLTLAIIGIAKFLAQHLRWAW